MRFHFPLFLLALLALPHALAQADNPYTWLRVLNVPIYEGPVESVTIAEREFDAYGNPGRLTQQDTWQFAPGNIPTHHLEIFEGDGPTMRTTTDWTFDGDNFPLEALETGTVEAGDPLETHTQYRLHGDTLIGQVDAPHYNGETRWVVDSGARRITRTATRETLRTRATRTFDAQWSANTFQAEALLDGRWELVNTVEYDPGGLRLRTSGMGATDRLEVHEYDTHGNPLRGTRENTIFGAASRRLVTWTYTYRNASTPQQAAPDAAPADGVTYRVDESRGTPRLIGSMNGREYVVHTNEEDHRFLFLIRVEDFDGDGLEDALIGGASGGNCCPPQYFIASVYRDHSSRSTDVPGGWEDPAYSDGVFTVESSDRVTEYRYDNGSIEILDERTIGEIPAQVEIRLGGGVMNAPVDIDLDGTYEQLACGEGRFIACRVEDQQGNVVVDFNLLCSRFGQLATVTNGYTDFVCNEQYVLTWDGTEYVEATTDE